MQPTLDFIKQIGRQAGDILENFIGEDLDIRHKSRTDLVTKADHASEDFLIGEIREAFPNHAINAEESGQLAGTLKHQWFIDPLDGTLNYAHGVPIYCVSIAYAYQGELMLGVIYDPTRDEMFSAENGQGAFLNDKPIDVSDYENLIDCMLVTGFPHDEWGTPNDNVINFIHFSKQTQTVRRLGSAALDIAYVAAGRLDGFWEVSINSWDVAAGGLLVREAGGKVTNLDGDPNFLKEPISIVAANPVIHSKMMPVIVKIE
ncbi:MAG: inositol monophosphatase family protein [Chloroflexota bacterium]|nr:inositol monophosphatase family protein [Chloroflexota bacterium]